MDLVYIDGYSAPLGPTAHEQWSTMVHKCSPGFGPHSDSSVKRSATLRPDDQLAYPANRSEFTT